MKLLSGVDAGFHEDELDFGLVGCRELMPDVRELLEMPTDEIDTLAVAASNAASAP